MSAAASVLTAKTLPDSDARRRLEALVGMDQTQKDLLAALRVAICPRGLQEWAQKQPHIQGAVRILLERPALFILGGDVGSGKTELAETIGDALARAERIDVTVFSLSLTARGTGFVGEMTQRIVAAFDEVRAWGEKRKDHGRSRGSGGLLFIDEADAIAQSRESGQMHHEDRAGVNALIRGIDDLTRANVPVAVIMATNRLDDIDPAVRRRAASVYAFGRPDESQRRALFINVLPDFERDPKFPQLIAATGAQAGEKHGFTYSDIMQRLIPTAVLEAYECKTNVLIGGMIEVAKRIVATPPFEPHSKGRGDSA